MKSISLRDLLRKLFRPAARKIAPRPHCFRPMLERLEDRWVPSAPTVIGVSPNSGPMTGGTMAVLTGSGFSNATEVYVGTSYAMYSIVTDTQMDIWTPAHAVGAADVTVVNPDGTSSTSSADLFTYTTIATTTSLSSSANPSTYGASVTLTATVSFSGGGIYAPTGTVSFLDGATTLGAETLSPGWTGSVATFTTSALPIGANAISAIYNGDSNFSGSTSSAFTQTVNPPPPMVSSVSPTTGPTTGDTLVLINGSNFTGATAVNFGWTAASAFQVLSDTEILAISPAASWTGAQNISVTTPSGASATSSADLFTYAAAAAPVVTAVAPNSGPTTGGTEVEIDGSGFTAATVVDFGSVPAANYCVEADNVILAWSPATATSCVDITVTTSYGTSATSSADQFTFVPSVTTVTPTSGPTTGGTAVEIDGSGFTSATVVDFGSASASFTVVSDSVIDATAPAGSAGVADVTVGTAYGMSPAWSGDQFTYLSPTSTSLSSSLGASYADQAVTLTAQISGGGSATPTGTVEFFDGATDLGLGVVQPGGPTGAEAVFTIASLPVGSNNLTAVYSGDGVFTGSTSGGLTVTVSPASEIPSSNVWTVIDTNDAPDDGNVVTQTGDLRFCLANAGSGAVIDFAIPGGGPQMIDIGSTLPQITHSILINGYTEGDGDRSNGPQIQLNGQGISGDGLDVFADGVTIEGLAIFGFGGDGVLLDNPDASAGDVLQGSYVGTDIGGDADIGNGTGVLVEGPSDTVGNPLDTITTATTIVSGNTNDGIDISGTNATGALISCDWIGVALTGLAPAPLPNKKEGVRAAKGNNVLHDSAVSGNSGDGVTVIGANNRIYDNFIGVGPNGVTPMGNGGDGVLVTGSSNFIGLPKQPPNIISGNKGNGVELQGGTGNQVRNNFIGLDDNGNVQGNSGDGVLVTKIFFNGASSNTIGGSTVLGQGNVISANGGSGVTIAGGSKTNVVAGNFIGTNSSGTDVFDGNGKPTGNGQAGANDSDGVFIDDASTANTVGGTTAAARNVISGNLNSGVHISDQGTTKNVVEGDFIGTDVNGAKALKNGTNGVTIEQGASKNTIGAPAPAPPAADTTVTVISGNSNAGVAILTGCNSNTVINCYIGTDATGKIALGNLYYGIDLEGDTNTIGGLTDALRNVISGNGPPAPANPWIATLGFGIFVTGSDAKNNTIEGDYIGTDMTGNASLGNDNSGVQVTADGAGNTIGGLAAGATCVISSNGAASTNKTTQPSFGVDLTTATGETVEGDDIGLSANGNTVLNNKTGGINGAQGNTVKNNNPNGQQ